MCDNKRNATGLACGCLTGFKCFVACNCMNSLVFFFEKREVVCTNVKGQMNQNLDIFSFESNVFIKYKRNIF